MAKSIFQISPLDAETDRLLAEVDDMAVSSPGLPDLPPISAPAPLPSSRGVSSGDGRRPSTDAKPTAAIMSAFEKAAVRYDVPINVLMALGEQESQYNPMAIGTQTQWGTAKGLMQYLDSTASRMGINPFDPVASIDAAARQLRDRLKKGYSMADAVKEHFAGPDRSKWGTKTARYGEEVLGRAARLKGELASQYQQPGPWYSPGATPSASDSRPVPADAVTALIGEAKPMARPRIADTFEDPNSLPAIVARYESEAQRKPDEGSISTPARPEGTFVNALKGAATASGEAFRQVGQGIRMQFDDAAGGAIDAMVDKVMPGATGLSLDEQRQAFGRTNTEADFQRSQARADAATPQFDSWWADAAYGGLQSLIQTTPGVAAGVVFGPAAGLAILGGQTEAGAYGKYRARGASPGMALLGGVGEGVVEAGTEMLPMGWLADRFGSTGLKQFLSGYLLREMPTEQAATFLQDAIDTAIANPDKTWGDFWGERLDAAGKTAVATLMQSGAFAGANAALSRMAREDAAQARDELAADPAINAEADAAISPGQSSGDIMPSPVAAQTEALSPPDVQTETPPVEHVAQPQPMPLAPSGPIGRALARAPVIPAPITSAHVPAPLAEDAAPAAMELHAAGIRMPVQILGETPDAIWARTESGEELQIPRADLESGDVQLVNPQAVAPKQPVETAPAVPANAPFPAAAGPVVPAPTDGQKAVGAPAAAKREVTTPPSTIVSPPATISNPETIAEQPAVKESLTTAVKPNLKGTLTGSSTVDAPGDLQQGFSDIAASISGGLIDMYHAQASAGAVKDKAGATSPILQVAKKVRERRGGTELTREEVENIARAVDGVTDTGQQRQAALRGIVDQFAPEAIDPETGEVLPATPEEKRVTPPVAPVEVAPPVPEASEEDLRARLKYLSSQARTNAGWTKPLLAERKRVEAAIDAINAGKASVPTSAPVPAAPAEQTGAVETPAIAQAAAEAATSPLNDLPEPTEAQKNAGNYRKGHVSIDGLNVTIENPAGTSRRPEWPPLKHTYGYVKRSEGADGDHVDVFLGPDAADTTKPVFIVDQTNEDGSFDEHKVMVGFADEQSARDGYLANYAPGWQGLGGVKEMPFTEFKEWVRDPAKTKAPAAIDAPAPVRDEVTEPTSTPAVDSVEPLAAVNPPPASPPAALPPASQASAQVDFGDMSAPDQQAAALRSAAEGQARSLPPSAKDWLISNRFAAERGTKGNVVVTMRGERELERLETAATAQPVREPVGQTLSGNREQEAFGYSARDVAPMSPNLKAAVERADTRPEDQRRILDAIDRALIPDGDMLEMGSPRWALERGYADIGPTPTGRRGRLTEAGRAKLTELGGNYTAPSQPQSVVRPVDKKNPNPFARKGEKFTFSEQVDYIGGNPADTYTVESVGKKEAWFVNDRTGGRSSLPNYQMQKALRSGVMKASAPVAAVDDGKHQAIEAGFAANRAVLSKFKKGDAVEFDVPGTFTQADGSKREGRLVRGTVTETLSKEQGTLKVTEESGAWYNVAARNLRKSADAATPAPFAQNQVFTADKVEAARARLREKMNRINSGIDPEVLVDGMTIAGAYIEAGVRKFADYAAAMRADFGDRITPYLLSFWEGARNYPGLDTSGMSDPTESRDHHAGLLTAGLPAEERDALGTEVAKPKQPKAGASRQLRDDWGVAHIDGASGVKDDFLSDAAAYMRAVAAALRPLGFEPHMTAKGKAGNPVVVSTGGSAVSGDVKLQLRYPENGTNIFATVGASSLRGTVPTNGTGVSLMYRVSTKEGDKQATSGTNRWAPVDLSAVDLADTIAWEVGRNEPQMTRGEVRPSQDVDRTPVTPTVKIEDFGEKMLGARKDYAQSLKERMTDAEGVDVSAEPLSVSWPEPNYQKLLDDGVEDYVVAAIRALRDAVPAKPQKAWKLKGWSENVRQLRDYANGLLNNTENGDAFRALSKEPGGKRAMEDLEGAIDLYLAAGHVHSLKGLSLRFHHYSLYRGERDVSLWAVEKRLKGTGWSNWPQEIVTAKTKQEAIDGFLAKLSADGLLQKDGGRQAVRFDIYSKRGMAQRFFIGKKIGTEYVDLKSFGTAAEARTYLRENHDALVAQLEAYRDIPSERRKVNAPRVGADHRSSGDVTPELFTERFGFRGVQFGNYVEDQRRQDDLNEAYDALLDMAGVLNIPARALSLGGQLGLAFGARGKGGIGASSAHYEPGNVVINLTKRRGAGSLAHEWWHALDNYFSRMGGNASGFLTDTGAAGESVRPEMVWAFRNVMEAIRKSAILTRSRELDKRRTRAYWATDVEMSARTFESYVIARLADAEHANDYLANIVSPDAFRIPEGYPYPTADEMPAIRAAFDELFNAIEARPIGEGIALFSEASQVVTTGDIFSSPSALRAAFDKSKLAPAIKRWMDAGRIVLHENSDTLPLGASRASIRAFLDGEPVVALTGNEFAPDGKPLTAKVTQWYREHGEETVDTPGIGHVLLDAKAVKNSASHGLGRNKAAAFAAIPDVLRRGKIVHSEPLVGDHAGGSAYFVAAPIRMGDQDMIEIVMIRSDNNAKRMYVHEVALREVLRQPAFKTSAYAAEAGMRSGAGAGALRTILHNIYAAKPEDDTSLASETRHGVQGLTTPDGRIHLVADQLTEVTALPVLLHEMFHAGVRPLLGDAQWSAIVDRLETLYRSAAARFASGEREMSPFWTAALDRVDQARPPSAYIGEEFGAYAIEERAKLPAGIGNVIERLLGAFKAWLLRRFGRQAGQITPAQLQSLAVAALRTQPFVVRNQAGDVRYSRRGPTVEEIDAATPRLLRNKFTDAMDGDFNALGTIPHDVLASEWARDHHLVAIRDYLRLKRRMDSARDKWHAKAADVAKAWYVFQKTSGNKINQEMMDLMHEATLAGVDPARPFASILTKADRNALAAGPDSSGYEEASERSQEDEQRRVDHGRLTKAWDALPEKAKRIYVDVRDTYRDMSNAFEQALLDNLSKALDIRHRQVKDTYDAELIRVADSDLSEEAKQAAFDEAEKVYNRESRVQRYAKGARMTRLRAFFETRNIAGPYFPLARFGNYFASARDKQSGEIVGFSRFETERAQQAFVAQMKKDGYAVEHGVLGAGGGLRDQVDPQFVVDVETILEGADISDAVRDAVWQRWLETLPDMSLRKSRIHRKGTAGYTTDAMRAFANHMFHGSHQLARLQHALDMEDALDQAEKQAERAKDPNRAKLMVNEMRRRHAFTMNPTGAPWSQKATSIAFIWFLAWRPSAALANLAQTAVMGVPILAAYDGKYRSMARASAELTKALKDFAIGRGHAERSASLTNEEREAMADAYESGVIDRTQSHDLAGLSETGIKYRPGPAMAMEVISWSFHHTERLNREITYLAAYRMARRKGEGHQQAMETAGDLTWLIHFNYTNTARPRFMQGDVAKAVLVFRNFQVNMLARLIRDTHQAFKGASEVDRKRARIQLIGVTGMMLASAGITGTWGYGLTMAVARAIAALMGSDDDPEEEFKYGVRATLGQRLGNAALEGVPGSTLGISLSERIGMPDLWFRSPDRELEGRAAWEYYALQSMGATVALGGSLWAGVDQAVNEGQMWRGIETAAPNFLKDPMRLWRYASEGAQTLKGDTVKENFSTLELFYQALGFTPAELARQYEINSAAKSKEKRITDRRQRIMVDYDKAVQAGESTADVKARLASFNKTHPGWAISAKDIRQSMRSRARRKAEMRNGIHVNPKIASELGLADSPASKSEESE